MNKLSILAAVVVAASLLAPRASYAKEDGELWEVSSQMDMSGMPEMKGRNLPPGVMAAMGGGARTSQICRGEDPREDVTKNQGTKDCQVTDFQQSGSKFTMSVKCPKGRTGTMEYVYNKARTEYKGTMHFSDERGRKMVMNTTGKKIGSCDAAKARDERQAQNDRYRAQAESDQAQAKVYGKMAEDQQIQSCAKAAESMDPNGLGFWGYCYRKSDANCKSVAAQTSQQSPKAAKACTAKAEELCRRFETTDGFLKAKQGSNLDGVERLCGVKAEDLRPRLCKSAVKSEFLDFIGANCPEDAKPLAKAHCAGRSYTTSESDPRHVDKKWYKFCVAYAGSEAEGSDHAEEAPARGGSERAADEAAADGKTAAKKAAKKAALNALKGLFGH